MDDHPHEPIIAGIAGLGRAGWGIHVPALESLATHYRVAAVQDPDPARQAEAAGRLACRTYADFPDLLADPEVELVVVASPSHRHAEMSIAALEAGKHVLVEKPFATSLQEADAMIAAAERAGRTLTCGHNLRYAADFLKVREVIASGKLGQILVIRITSHGFGRRWDWQTLREFGGGLLNNNGSHLIDLALLLLGDGEADVSCQMVRTPLCSGDAEDHVKATLRAPGAPVIEVEVTSACAYPQEKWLIMGTQGGLAGSAAQLRWKCIDPRLLPPRPVSREPTPDRSYNSEPLPWVEEVCDLSKEPGGATHRRLYLDLYATLRQGAPLAITGASLRRQIAVLERCRHLS